MSGNRGTQPKNAVHERASAENPCRVTRSLVLASLFPRSRTDAGALIDALRHIRGRGFGCVEFYTEPGRDAEIAAALRDAGLESVFIGVYALKGAGDSLCAPDEAERLRAVDTLRGSVDRAAALGSRAVMINSGFLPDDPARIDDACAQYVRSVLAAYAYIRERGYAVDITLEPGDSHVQSMQLLGPTARVLETAAAIRAECPGYALTMDVAHLREEGEDILPALTATLPYCAHVHLCNCLLADRAHPLYGDKHVDFDCPGACFSYADFEGMYRALLPLYKGRDWTVSLEIECRADDNAAWFDEVARRCAWIMEDA